MPISAKPYRQKAFATIKGRRMAYIEADTGNAIVFQHGNPTSSYLWRNIMPHCEGLGRLIACDLIGMGDSDKLENSGADRYTYADHRDYLSGIATACRVSFTWKRSSRRSHGPTGRRMHGALFRASDPKAVKRWFWRKTYSLNGCCPAPSYAGSVRRRWPLTAGPSLIRARTGGPLLHGRAC